ncbi:MAG: c-type cytochrome biogenesis protein CcsB [Deltaproteobacteria bacterium]|nr:c-type cytochrome biogenesis protein CcsB [Deltaproteobacteria bacterium]
MKDTYLISIVTFVYFFSAFLFLTAFIFRSDRTNRGAAVITVIGFITQTAAIILRWVHSYHIGYGHAPLANFYESLVFFSWSITVMLLFMRKRYRGSLIGAVSCFFAFLLLAYASLSGRVAGEIEPLIPALQSNWLISHVMSSFLAYACFAISFATSIMYLVKRQEVGRFVSLLPDKELLDEVTYRMISIGFVLLTLGIVTGAAWADMAWGRYWGWDPKETWSFITWLIYGTYLHARVTRGWRGLRMSLLAIIGFAAVIFTYLGVNYILAGLHSYM